MRLMNAMLSCASPERGFSLVKVAELRPCDARQADLEMFKGATATFATEVLHHKETTTHAPSLPQNTHFLEIHHD